MTVGVEEAGRRGELTPAELAALTDRLDQARPGLLHGPLTATLIAGGRSNLTYRLTDGRGEWILRRPPLGHVLATAHDMRREHRLLSALAGTTVPAPAPVLLVEGDSVLGAPCYVMELVEGEVYRSADQLGALSPEQAGRLADELVDVLAELHAVRPSDVGLDGFGRPDGYLQRQVRRWTMQLASSASRELPDAERLAARLSEDVPDGRSAGIVHGDYRLDNVVVAPGGATVAAVLDWELATVGDPLVDLASTAVWWDGFAGLDSPVAAVPGDVPGFPSSAGMVDRYAERAGADLRRLHWYVGLSYYKIAAIFELLHYRHLQGNSVGEGFERLGPMVPELLSRGHDALDRDV